MKKDLYGVIGLGMFGSSVARNLAKFKQEVLAVDRDEEKVTQVEGNGIYAVRADATNEEALKQTGVQNAETVIIAIGENIESSILATMICKKLNIPRIIVKADNHLHANVLQYIGVDKVVFPEDEMGARLATSLVTGILMDYIDMAPNISIMEMKVPQKYVGRSLSQLQLPRKHGISVLVIKRGEEVIVSPSGDTSFNKEDVIIVLGDRDSIERIRE